MANSDPIIDPKIGEIWWIDFDSPNDEADEKEDYALSSGAKGSEQKHRRPAVVIITKFTPESHSVCTVIPFTKWKQHHNDRLYLIVVEKSSTNGLNLDSSALIGQIQTVSFSRFRKKTGILEDKYLQAIKKTILLAIQYEDI